MRPSGRHPLGATSATQEKGLIIVHTGPGKGKITAALGLAFRALGQEMKVGIVQFIKGAIRTGEAALVKRLGLVLRTAIASPVWRGGTCCFCR